VLAGINANYEIASVLLDYSADPNAAGQGWSPLHQIALARRWTRGFNLPGPEHRDQMSSLALARKLVAHGADVNARLTAEPHDGNGNGLKRLGATPFLLATKQGQSIRFHEQQVRPMGRSAGGGQSVKQMERVL